MTATPPNGWCDAYWLTGNAPGGHACHAATGRLPG
jgi:hypothetical protein